MTDSFLKNIKILIVEDSKTERDLLVNLIKKYFANILEASNGEEAYEIYKAQKDIDIIITDINMPKLSGIELLKKVRETDLSLPFIFVTGGTKLSDILTIINLNISSFLLKPINFNLLLQKIDFLCEKKYYKYELSNKKREIEHYKQAVDRTALIFKMDINGVITYMNYSMREISGYGIEYFNKLKFDDIIHDDIPKKYIEEGWEHVKNGELWKGNTKFLSKDGDTFYLNNTVFKANNEKEEFILVAFLTTKENLEKRDFHKKVLMKIQESNKREFELKKQIEDLSRENSKYKLFYEKNIEYMNLLSKKNKEKERQLTHYEIQGSKVSEKYERFMKTKKEEVDNYLKILGIEKQKNDELTLKNSELLDVVESLKAKCENLENEIKIKNSRIANLLDLVSDKNNEKEKSLKKGFLDFQI